MQVTVSGDASFRRFALGCRKASGPRFDEHMDDGLLAAGEDMASAIHVTTDIYMPSGYEELFRSRLITKAELNRPLRRVTVIAYARGRTGRRDVRRLDLGQLRHPVYGRYRTLKSGRRMENPWSVTNIRPGFFTNSIRFAAPGAIGRRLNTALRKALAEVNKT